MKAIAKRRERRAAYHAIPAAERPEWSKFRVAGSRRPFARAVDLYRRSMEIVKRGLPPLGMMAALAALPPYTSRGHGRGMRGGLVPRSQTDRSRYNGDGSQKR